MTTAAMAAPATSCAEFFSVTDATRFATSGGDAAALLALEPELERVLQQLDEKLE